MVRKGLVQTEPGGCVFLKSTQALVPMTPPTCFCLFTDPPWQSLLHVFICPETNAVLEKSFCLIHNEFSNENLNSEKVCVWLDSSIQKQCCSFSTVSGINCSLKQS